MSRRLLEPAAIGICLLLLAGLAFADILYLKNGHKWEGKILSENGREVKIKTVGGVLTFPMSEVDRIERRKTKADEYKERRAKIGDDDIPGLLELARWCEEQRLVVQKRKLYRELTRKVPDHPQVRRAMGQIYRDGKWVNTPKDFEPPTVSAGEKKKVEKALAILTFPKGWKVVIEGKKATATGPDLYARAPVLTAEFGDAEPSFPEKEGWEKPAEVTAAGLTGKRSRRVVTEGRIEHVELLAILPKATFRLTALLIEEDAYAPALDLALRTLSIEAPPADYVNKRYHYQLNHPRGEGWQVRQTDGNDLMIDHRGQQVEDWAHLEVVTGDGDEYAQVEKGLENLVDYMKKMGDIKEDKEITFAGKKARFVDGTFIAAGFPNRRRVIALAHNKRFYLIYLTQHEFGCDRTDICWTKLIESFRFLD